jgi:hypothetical protein
MAQKIKFQDKVVVAMGTSRVNAHGAAAISRKHKGKSFTWIITEECTFRRTEDLKNEGIV